ncbi:MAG TPA: hypothetical protein VJ965_05090 [Anaerolineales bacterium]|nr:hypothetical protein [Anaerolineales bacterium]
MTIQAEHFQRALDYLLEETFNSVYGIYLDKGTSLFETLAGITAEEASIPVGGQCATLAAQVKHIAFYLDVIVDAFHNPNSPPADWEAIWRNTGAVSPDEWEAIKAALRESLNQVKTLLKNKNDWTNDREIGRAMGVVVHTAYHLGEIRQALCILKDDRAVS